MSRKLLTKSLILGVCTALIFVSGTSVVAAAVSSTGSSSATLSTTTTVAPTCMGWSAFSSVSYLVNGMPETSIYTKVTQGATVTALFKIKPSCNATQVGIASYDAVSSHGNQQAFGLQTLSAKSDGSFLPDNTTHSVSVVVPNCYFQVDFYTGTAAAPGDLYSTSGRLVGTDVGGTSACVNGTGTTTTTAPRSTSSTTAPSTSSTSSTSTTAPSTSSTSTTIISSTSTSTSSSTTTTAPSVGAAGDSTTTTAPAVGAESCTATPTSKFTNYSVTVGSNTYQRLSSVTSGDTVTVHFTVGANCSEQLSLASYQATSLSTTQTGVLGQTLFSSDTGIFGPGNHTLTVTIPNCMYQVDFVKGTVITNFGPVGSTNYYGSRILDTAVGGITSCTGNQPSGTTTTTTRPVTTTTSPSVGAEQVTTSTTRPNDVQVQSVTTTTTPAVAAADVTTTTTTTTPAVDAVSVAPTSLATTGFDMVPIICLGLMLLGVGGFFVQSGRRLTAATVAASDTTPKHLRRRR